MTPINDLLLQFAAATDAQSQRAALVSMIKAKQVHEAARNSSFNEGLHKLGQAIKDSNEGHQPLGAAVGLPERGHPIKDGNEGHEPLLAAATLERAAAVVKRLRPQIDELLQQSITDQLPDLHQLKDRNDRQYAARTWRAVRSPWYVDYLAKAAVQEESGENIRKECLEGVITLSADISAALSTLQQAFKVTNFETKKPGDSVGRRLKRILELFTTILLESHKPLGDNVARALSLLVRRAFHDTGLPRSIVIKRDVTHQIAKLIHGIVRTSFSYAGDDRTYEALLVAQDWFDTSDWVDLCESSHAIVQLQNDLQESILLIAKFGVTDDALRRTLGTALGSRKRAEEVCREIATTTPGLSRDVRDRLAGVSSRRRSTSAAESQEWSMDKVLAELLIETDRLSAASNVVQTGVLPEVSTVLPHSVRSLSTLTGLADAFSNRMALALKRRSLRARGDVGDEVEFSPLEHQIRGGGIPDRRVRIVSPLVERISEDGVPHIVLKALVEPVAD